MGASAACCCLNRDDSLIPAEESKCRMPSSYMAFERTPVTIQRINSNADLSSIKTWWGINPMSPDPRMEKSMPGHVLVTNLMEVACLRSMGNNHFCEAFPLDRLCTLGNKYLIWCMKYGEMSIVSLHHIVHDEMYGRIFCAETGNPWYNKLKVLCTPINLILSVCKGPKDAATAGAFFGSKNVEFWHLTGSHNYDVAVVSFDIYSVLSLKMLLPTLAFKEGRICDYHLISYGDTAVVASYRIAATRELIETMKTFSCAPCKNEID